MRTHHAVIVGGSYADGSTNMNTNVVGRLAPLDGAGCDTEEANHLDNSQQLHGRG